MSDEDIKEEPSLETEEEKTEKAHDEEEEEPPLVASNFSIAIHTLLHSAHQSHGLLHDDYSAYRSYVTRRLSRLRHNPSVSKHLTHGSKSMHKKTKNIKK